MLDDIEDIFPRLEEDLRKELGIELTNEQQESISEMIVNIYANQEENRNEHYIYSRSKI